MDEDISSGVNPRLRSRHSSRLILLPLTATPTENPARLKN